MELAGTPRVCLDGMMECVSGEIERVLGQMPDTLLEARRMVTRELGFEPRPEELQAVVRLARDEAPRGACRDLPRQMLGLKLLIEQAQKDFWDSPGLDRGRIRRVHDAIPELSQAADEIDARLSETIDRAELPLTDLDRLRDIAAALSPPVEALTAMSILAPRLELFADQPGKRELKTAVPNLVQAEIDWIQDSVHPVGGGEAGPSRVCLDAIALRTVIQDDIDFWRTALADHADEAHELRQVAEQAFRRTETAYRVISERLQKQQEIALAAGLSEFCDDLRRIRGDLFSSHRRLAALTRGETATSVGASSAGPEVTEDDGDTGEALPTTRRSTREADVSREDRTAGEAEQSADEDAATGSEPLRMWRMLAATVVLFGLTLIVHLTLPQPLPDPIAVSPSDFPDTGIVSTHPLGALLCAQVDSWERLPAAERTRRLEQLGRQAVHRGFNAVYLVDAQGHAIAQWSRREGVGLF